MVASDGHMAGSCRHDWRSHLSENTIKTVSNTTAKHFCLWYISYDLKYFYSILFCIAIKNLPAGNLSILHWPQAD